MSYAIPFARSVSSARQRSPFTAAPNDQALIQVARRLYDLRRRRDAIMDGGLFSEPAWDILLDLFVSHHDGRQLSVSAVCIGARAPSATALRYLTMLQDAGLVHRTRAETDGRRSHVQLSPTGRQRMVELLEMLVVR